MEKLTFLFWVTSSLVWCVSILLVRGISYTAWTRKQERNIQLFHHISFLVVYISLTIVLTFASFSLGSTKSLQFLLAFSIMVISAFMISQNRTIKKGLSRLTCPKYLRKGGFTVRVSDVKYVFHPENKVIVESDHLGSLVYGNVIIDGIDTGIDIRITNIPTDSNIKIGDDVVGVDMTDYYVSGRYSPKVILGEQIPING